HTFVPAIFLWLMLSRKRSTFVSAMLVGVVVLAVTAPWWMTVLNYHGVWPLLNGMQTGQKTLAVFHLLFFVFTEEPYATVIAILGLIGIGYCLVRREYLLPLWMTIPFFVEGRSAAGPAGIPLAMLAAIGLVNVVVTGIRAATGKESGLSEQVSPIERNLFVYLLVYLIFSTYMFGSGLSNAILYPEDRKAMNWVRDNTPSDARFLVLTGTTSVSCDSVLEWFPALTGRQSLYTVQGTEWTQGRNFNDYVRSTYPVQRCLSSGDVSCLDAAIDRSQYDYVYISKLQRVNNCASIDLQRTFPFFLAAMRADESFDMIYETEEVAVFERP
ncbi:MAG: hypothetical protein WCC12_04420, partial [Anaerolineales bacterium]